MHVPSPPEPICDMLSFLLARASLAASLAIDRIAAISPPTSTTMTVGIVVRLSMFLQLTSRHHALARCRRPISSLEKSRTRSCPKYRDEPASDGRRPLELPHRATCPPTIPGLSTTGMRVRIAASSTLPTPHSLNAPLAPPAKHGRRAARSGERAVEPPHERRGVLVQRSSPQIGRPRLRYLRGVRAVAEGIDDREQGDALRRRGRPAMSPLGRALPALGRIRVLLGDVVQWAQRAPPSRFLHVIHSRRESLARDSLIALLHHHHRSQSGHHGYRDSSRWVRVLQFVPGQLVREGTQVPRCGLCTIRMSAIRVREAGRSLCLGTQNSFSAILRQCPFGRGDNR